MLSTISETLLNWFDQNGRKNLPWQQNKTPYRVWISEIMLQQTQVKTVIPYYERFMQRFPALVDLANASEDEVLSYWSGLGYYARARNLKKTAEIIRDQYDGEFPQEFEQVLALPGIGRSTAGAVLSLSLDQHHVILDGNVKRVMARLHKVEGWYGHTKVMAELWDLAEKYTPVERIADYNQAIMDLGAMVCVRGKSAKCGECPLNEHCEAEKDGVVDQFPHSKPKKQIPVKKTRMLMIKNRTGDYYLEKRPPTGIWGGLWSFPECDLNQELLKFCENFIGHEIEELSEWSEIRHTFSHFHLDITPVHITIGNPKNFVMEEKQSVWYKLSQTKDRGYAAPVLKLLEQLNTNIGV